MGVRFTSLITLGLLSALAVATVHAEDAQPAAVAPSLSDKSVESIRLLDDIPNYATALASQWRSADVSPRIGQFITDTSHYGRLRELTAPESLALSDCIALALANNTSLEISRLGPLGARAQVRRSYAIFDPSLFADASKDRSVRESGNILQGALNSETDNVNVDGGVRKTLTSGGQLTASWRNNRLVSNSSFLTLRPQYTTDFVLSLNQPLLRDFGLYFTTLQVRIARTTEQSAVKTYEASLANTIKSVEQAYWSLVQANENVSVQEQGLTLAKELQRQNEGKFNVGAAPRTAVLEAQAEVARREADLIKARTASSIARDSLRALLNAGRDGGASLAVVEPGDKPVVEPYSIDLDRSLASALERRPELAAAKLSLQGSGMQLKIAENQLLPRLNAVGLLGTNGLSGGAVPKTNTAGQIVINPYNGPYEDGLNRNFDGRYYEYSAGVTVEVPLSNIQARADYSQAHVGVEQARLSLQQLQESVTLEVKTAVTNLQSDLKSIEATRIARELAEENLRNQKARYDVGLATTKDLLDYLDRLTQAKFAETSALTTYNTDLAELRRVEGTLLEARHVELTAGEDEPTPFWAQF
ncbi:MAG: TolC family protein [Deltaproteobacteria bacterium]|nr:TolC family protein [Deltaproteobacteria bacterium]MBI3390958.1 TolC family protein [Deltaproteobacteria bacterium]